MRGIEKSPKTLMTLLPGERTAINRHMNYPEMCAEWWYEKLHNHFKNGQLTKSNMLNNVPGAHSLLKKFPHDPDKRMYWVVGRS